MQRMNSRHFQMSKPVPHEKDGERMDKIKHALRGVGRNTCLETVSRLFSFLGIPFSLKSTHVVHRIGHLTS